MQVLQILNAKRRWACASHVENRRRRCVMRLDYRQEVQARQHLEVLCRYHTSSILGSERRGGPDVVVEKTWKLLLDAMTCKVHAECDSAGMFRAKVLREWKQAVANWDECPDGWTEACALMLLPDPRQAVFDLLGRHRQELRDAASKEGAVDMASQAEGSRDKKRPRLN